MANVWQKAFNRIFWKNRPNPTTPLGESKLLPMDASIDEMDDRILNLNTTKADQSDFLTAVKSITFTESTGTFRITFFNDTYVDINTDIEKIPVNFDYDDDPTSAHYQQLILTLDDGTVKYIDLSALITQYEFLASSTIQPVVGTGGVISFNVINGSITEEKLEPNFLASCRLEVTKATQQAENAEAWAKGTKNDVPVASTEPQYNNHAKKFKEDAEAYGVGQRNGVDVTSGDPAYQNNSKYYAQQAEASLSNTVRSFNGRTGQVAPQSGDYTIGQVSPLNGATVGQVPIVTNVGTSQEPVYQFAMGLVSGGGIGTCSSIQPMSMAYLVVPNEGFSVTTGSYLSVIFSNDFVWLGTNSLRIAIGSDLYNVQVNGQAPEQNKVYVKSGSAGIFVYDGTYFQLIGTSGGGHEILNASGTAQTQRANLQYKDAFISDDSQNGRTIVENIKEHTTASDYENATEDGIHVIDDGNDVPIGDSEVDSVSVTASSDTYRSLINKLRDEIDFSKLTQEAYIMLGANKFVLAHFENGEYQFTNVIAYSTSALATIFLLENTNGQYRDCSLAQNSGASNSDKSTSSIANGTKLTLYYGTSSTVINLKTDANYCMMSDGVTSVESALTNVDTLYDGTLSSGSSTALAKGISNYRQIVIEFAVAEDISGTGATQITIVNPRLNIPYIMSVSLYINPTLYNNVAGIKFTDNTHISYVSSYKNGWSHDSVIKRVYGLH